MSSAISNLLCRSWRLMAHALPLCIQCFPTRRAAQSHPHPVLPRLPTCSLRVQHQRHSLVVTASQDNGAVSVQDMSQSKQAAGAQAADRLLAHPAPLQQLPKLEPLDEQYEQKMAFTPYANWIIPGHLMLGRYPYIEPSRCQAREKAEKQLDMILRAGITSFICLQEELPSHDEMKIGGHNGFMPYKAVAQMMAASLSGPVTQEELDGLRNPQLDKFLPPKKKGNPQSTRRTLNFGYDPIVDLNLPDKDQQPKQQRSLVLVGQKEVHNVDIAAGASGICFFPKMLRLVDGLKSRILGGEVVYMHCWGGRGRAGTIASCFLAACYGLSADEILARIQRAFDTRQDGGRQSPETPAQKEFVRNFVDELKQ